MAAQQGGPVVASQPRFAEDHSGPKQVLEAVVDAIRPSTPPPVASTRTYSSLSRPGPERSALVFRPAVPASPSTPDISPSTAPTPRLPAQLPVPAQESLPYRFPFTPSAEASLSRSSPPSKLSPFQGLRRGSLAPPTSARVETRRGSDPANMELARLTSPGAGPSTSRDTVEMTSVSLRAGMLRQRTRADDKGHGLPVGERSKEDIAMAKWRRWIVENPDAGPRETSPTRSRKNSPAGNNIPMVPLAPALTPSRSPSGQTRISTSRTDSDGSGPRVGRIDYAKADHVTTETTRALADVELAVDETVLARTGRTSSQPRRMSANPRVSDIENPFIDISSRLSSRRVRPLVIELIHGLGHYVDAVWSLRYPGKPCPWVMGTQTPERRKSIITDQAASPSWKSRMLTAVQSGKSEGFVPPPTMADLKFWEDEVRYSLRDVDDVVGIYKGVAWAFNTAIMTGQYGEVQSSNVVGKDGEGGNIARLLNDLEEAMWGDAAPRATDLAYELPEDFDPYAIPSADELAAGGGGPPLSAFFADSSGARASSSAPPSGETYSPDGLPELQAHGAEGSDDSALPTSPIRSQVSTPTPKPVSDPLSLEAYKVESGGMTLEELGRKRHEQWLASRAEVPW